MDDDSFVFEEGKDPGEGYLRIVGSVPKIQKVRSEREVTFREIHEVVFGKGRSKLIKEYTKQSTVDGIIRSERQFRILGLTKSGKPVVVVLTPRDEGGLAKRIITAWKVSKNSKIVKHFISQFPHLERELA